MDLTHRVFLNAAAILVAAPLAAQTPLPVDAKALLPHRDSLVVLVNGQEKGASVTSLARSGTGFTYHEQTAIGAVMQQATTVQLGPGGQAERVSQSGTARGMPGSIEITYAGGRVTGQVQAVMADGPKSFSVDTVLPAGVVDDNSLQALLPALPWAEGAGWEFPMYSAGANQVTQMTLRVVGTQTAMVPAGAFDAYRAELSGGGTHVAFLILKRKPHTVLLVETTGAPLRFELVSGGGL
jgi:hypothetical protein